MMDLDMKQISPWYVYRQVAELGFVIAIPLVISVLAGRWLDERFGFRAFFIIIALPISLLTSAYVIYKKIKSIENG